MKKSQNIGTKNAFMPRKNKEKEKKLVNIYIIKS